MSAENNRNVICIVPCGKMQIWDKNPNLGPTKAKYAYIGPFASKCREYAEKFYPESWCILSTKYGFLFPDDVVPGPYNVSFTDKKSNPISSEELRKQESAKKIDRYDHIIVVAGKDYTNMIKSIFTDKNVYNPISNCKKSGFMMQKLKNAIENESPL